MFTPDHFHPMLVHFPIALVIFGFIADCATLYFKKEACLSKLGFYLLLAGTLMAFLALSTGAIFTEEMSGAAGAVKETHENFAWITLGLLILTSGLRIGLQKKENTRLKWTAFACYALAAVSVSITGYYGGTLVYNYMMPL